MSTAGKEAHRGREAQGREAYAQGSAIDLSDEVTDPLGEAQYLQKVGWKKVPLAEASNPKKRWLDPLSARPAQQVLVIPEARDLAGRVIKDAVYQIVESVPAWYYSRLEAVAIQRDRDRARKGKV